MRSRGRLDGKEVEQSGATVDILEAGNRSAAIAKDLVDHYVDGILPDGFRVQVARHPKLAAIRYQKTIRGGRRGTGVTMRRGRPGFEAFREALEAHVSAGGTKVIEGTCPGQAVTHYVNPEIGLNVVRDAKGTFRTAWRLSEEQLRGVVETGRLY